MVQGVIVIVRNSHVGSLAIRQVYRRLRLICHASQHACHRIDGCEHDDVQLSEAIKALSRDLNRQDDFENKKARYELFQTGQQDVVFKLREVMRTGSRSISYARCVPMPTG